MQNYNGQRWRFEFKYADAPGTTKSMHVAIESLELDKVFVVYPGKEQYSLTEKIEVMALCKVVELFGLKL